MKRNFVLIALGAVVALVSSIQAAELPRLAQFVRLVPGWNAVYLKVAPCETPDELFANWPVDVVGLYDAAAFTATRQFTAALDSEGVSPTGMRVWRRGEPDASTLKTVIGNAVYLCRATEAFETSICGVPEAMRLSWHPASDAGAVLNYVGVSLASTSSTTRQSLTDYFSGLTVGHTFMKTIYGTSATGPVPSPIGATTACDGTVIVMDARTVSDWSGVLHVSPAMGVAFSTNLLTTTVEVRNDGATARTARLTMRMEDGVGDRLPVPRILWRDQSGAAGWVAANELPTVSPARRMAPGEMWKISLALDRTQFNRVARGTRYGGLLTVEDVDGGSGFATTIPLSAVSDGGETMRTAWPAGLWLCEARLNEVGAVATLEQLEAESEATTMAVTPGDVPTKAGGVMRARLLLHVDSAGNMGLVQRVSIVAATNGAGVASLGLYAATAARPAGSVEQMRLSSVVLPADLGVVAPTNGAQFGAVAQFSFTVSEQSKVNPYRHALHPNHDGLRSDFATPAPSGDQLSNYLAPVKPELFSVGNTIELVWNANTGSAWTPDEMLGGTCTWTLRNLRSEADIQVRGPFTMKRVSTDPVLNR